MIFQEWLVCDRMASRRWIACRTLCTRTLRRVPRPWHLHELVRAGGRDDDKERRAHSAAAPRVRTKRETAAASGATAPPAQRPPRTCPT